MNSPIASSYFCCSALGEEKHERRYIVTVPGAGYRFVASVQVSRAPEAAPSRTGRAGAVADAWPPASLAVLPFKTIPATEGEEVLGLGMADALIMKLGGLRLVKVRPTTAVMRYVGPEHDPLTAGRDLGVDALLDGYYQRHGDQIRVSLQIIRVRDGVTLWAAKFDESFTNFFATQDSVSEHVVRELELELSGAERRHLRKNSTDNPEAFRAYIKGRYFWSRRTPEGLRKGLEYARQAVALDPAYGAAYVGIADPYNLLGAQQLAERRYVPPSGMALIYTGLGEREKAYRWLEKAFAVRDINLLWLRVNPRLDALRADAEFKELLRRVGIPGAEG